MREVVYVSGPMSTSGEPGNNLHNAVQAAAKLTYEGFLPYVPHLVWLQHAIAPWVAVATWQQMTLAWVDRSDALLRLHGDSRGADEEVRRAINQHIPVFYAMEHLLTEFRARRSE